jgi:hypothetical protein
MGEPADHERDQDTRPTDPADRGPGAHSGHESRQQNRVVPGTASAAEGYQSERGGTRDGDPLAGVERNPQDAARAADEDTPDATSDRPED